MSLLEEIEELRKKWHRHKHRARHLLFTLGWCKQTIKGRNMDLTMPLVNAAGQPSTVTAIGSPVDASGNPSKATLSSTNYTSSDPTVFTVAPDPNTPNGAIVMAVGEGTAVLKETATATEPDGVTTDIVQGSANITITAVTPPPPPPAAALVITFGTPK